MEIATCTYNIKQTLKLSETYNKQNCALPEAILKPHLTLRLDPIILELSNWQEADKLFLYYLLMPHLWQQLRW